MFILFLVGVAFYFFEVSLPLK